ncbi:glycoside hydrolase family protein [Sphingobacterium sp. DK4209]|uniref:Lysozyme n=1 Tax=Sphingobacterium zhuxiongii TaxID=2662364 RepID=A0A5Q0QCV9_9SPHI|nr:MULTISPECIES: lysozyme [unclassified Sphingobacterium]MVZ65046.1 glycoside hydrolase family protein [Sphingobacterium sp. DK4209]QGA25382.1 glycoside hydrolase family protein [Sphingobacterium sp. dk4302]
MRTGEKGIALIKSFEGFYSKPYKDPIGIPTIGYGFTYYLPDRRKVTMQDRPLTEHQATCMLQEILKGYESDVLRLVKKSLTQNQFDALVSFTFNLGGANLSKSTLLRKVNANPNDPTIASEFVKWNKAGGKVLNGLTRRRKAEAELYFSK